MASVATLTDTTLVGQNEEQLVTMIVDNQLFGIPILQVQDIVEASKITPVPLAPSAIAGVLNLRGRIVTVIDLRKLLGNTEEVPWDSQMGVTVEYKGDLYTLLVDAIGDVRTLPKRDFDSAPSTMEDKVRQICSGIFRLRGNLLVVLDVARILLPEAIEATPKLSVEDRRARKDAAQAASDGTRAEKGRQLSTLMTDLNAYESDFDSGLGSVSGNSDDIKARKKANRNRRPVSERWQEVLEDKARREGSTVYRMREPNEETLEDAREDAKKQESAWEAELQSRQENTYESRLSEPDDQDMDLASDDPVAADPDVADLASDEPVAVDFDGADRASDEPVAVDLDVADLASDEPVTVDLDVADPASDNLMTDEPVAEDTVSADPILDEPASEDTVSADPILDDLTSLDSPDLDEPLAPLSTADETEGSADTGSAISDWWSKMRSKPDSDKKPMASVTTDETPVVPDAEDDAASAGDEATASEGKGKSSKKKGPSLKSKLTGKGKKKK